MIFTPSSDFLDFSWLDESSSSGSGNSPESPKPTQPVGDKVFRPRRSHTKSRKGCTNCKSRRIKCDETKPGCNQCQKHDITCRYAPPKGASDSKNCKAITAIPATYDVSHPLLSGKASSMALSLTAESIATMIYPQKAGYHSANKGLVHTLQHFESIAYTTLGSPAHQQVLRDHALALSQNTPFLLHAIFAFSARHLQHVQPDNPKYSLEAAYHRSRAFQLYNERSKIPTSATEMDALFTGYMILCALSFHANQEASPSDPIHSSFLWAPETSNEWLDTVCLIGNLFRYTDLKSYIPHSVWLPILSDIDDKQNSFTDQRSGPVGLSPPFVSLCNITPSSNAINNPYHAALRLLTPMLHIEASIESFSKLITFPCRMRPEFVELYRARDPAALLIMGCWFAQMCKVDHWWCKARAQTECWAICNFLDGWPDARVQALLQYPKEKCGYVGIDMDAIQTCVFGM